MQGMRPNLPLHGQVGPLFPTRKIIGHMSCKCYLSAIVDCFDGKAVSHLLSKRLDADLANATLVKALDGVPRRGSSCTAIADVITDGQDG